MKFWLLILGVMTPMASAQEISVLSGGAAKSFIEPLAASFPGAKVKLEFQPMGKLTQSLAQGYPADMVVVTSEVLPTLGNSVSLPGKDRKSVV